MFSKFELTNKGVELLNRVIAESKTLKFTKFQIGKGEFSGDKKTLTQLVSKFDEFNVTEKNVLPNNITNIKGFYDNRNVSVSTKFTEIGLMAQLGDDSLTEVLFSYANQPTDEAETIPAKESYFSRTFSVMNRTDNVTSITFDLTIRQDKYNFGTLAEMKAADYLDIGDKVTLWGNAALGDSSFKMYIITDQAQPIQLNNKLYAKEYFKIVNNLTTGGANNALSGQMGKELNENKQNKTDSGLQTDSKEIVGAINESLWKIGYYRLSGVVDLNDITTSGFYLRSSVSGVTITNTPPGLNSYFHLSVFKQDFCVYQIYYDGSVTGLNKEYQKVFIRRYNNITKLWTEWQEILTTNSSLFLGNAGITAVKYIQENAIKEAGKSYTDSVTGKLYYCYKQAPATVVTVDSEYFYPATNNDLAKNMFNVFEEVEIYPTTAMKQSQSVDIDFNNYSEYKYINLYYGFTDKAGVLGARISVKELLALGDLLLDQMSVGLGGYNDVVEFVFKKTMFNVIYKTVTSDDIFKYIKLTVSYV